MSEQENIFGIETPKDVRGAEGVKIAYFTLLRARVKDVQRWAREEISDVLHFWDKLKRRIPEPECPEAGKLKEKLAILEQSRKAESFLFELIVKTNVPKLFLVLSPEERRRFIERLKKKEYYSIYGDGPIIAEMSTLLATYIAKDEEMGEGNQGEHFVDAFVNRVAPQEEKLTIGCKYWGVITGVNRGEVSITVGFGENVFRGRYYLERFMTLEQGTDVEVVCDSCDNNNPRQDILFRDLKVLRRPPKKETMDTGALTADYFCQRLQPFQNQKAWKYIEGVLVILLTKTPEQLPNIISECRNYRLKQLFEYMEQVRIDDRERFNGLVQEIYDRLFPKVEIRKTYQGKVVKVMEFGVFVEIFPGQEGLCHISNMSKDCVGEPASKESFEQPAIKLKAGDTVEVTVDSIDHQRDRIILTNLEKVVGRDGFEPPKA